MIDNKENLDISLYNYFIKYTYDNFAYVFKDKDTNTLPCLLDSYQAIAVKSLAKELGLKRYSKLKKAEVIDMLIAFYENNISSILKLLSYNELELLYNLSKTEYNDFTFNPRLFPLYNGLEHLGLIYRISFYSAHYITVPVEFKSSIEAIYNDKKYINSLKKFNKKIALIDGVMIATGLLTAKQLTDFLNSTKYLDDNLRFYLDYLNRCYFNSFKEYTYIHPYMLMPDYIITQSQNYRCSLVNLNNIDYLISLGEAPTSTWGPLEYTLKDYITNKNISNKSAESIVDTIIFYYRNDCAIGFILSILADNKVIPNNFDDAQRLANLLVKLHNNSPNWILKGHSPTEFSKLYKF